MTLERAIEILHPNTTRDALVEVEYYGGFNGREAMIKACEDACIVSCEVMQEKLERDNGCATCNKKDSFARYHEFPFCPMCGKDLKDDEDKNISRKIVEAFLKPK